MMLRVTGWTWNPIAKRIRVRPPMFLFLPRQHFDRYSRNLCMQLGQQFLLLCLVCHVLRANHHVMDRSSMLLVVSALRAILNTIENWTSATTRTRRNMPGPSPHRWLCSNLQMCGVRSCTHSIGLPLRSDCNVKMRLSLMSKYHINHCPHLPFDQRHVPQMREAM